MPAGQVNITIPMTGKTLVSDTVRALAAARYVLPDERRGQYGGIYRQLVGKGITAAEFAEIIARIVRRWPDKELLPNEALREDVCAGTPATPAPAIEAIRADVFFGEQGLMKKCRLWEVAQLWDFTSKEDPPMNVRKRISPSRQECDDWLPRLRGISRKATGTSHPTLCGCRECTGGYTLFNEHDEGYYCEDCAQAAQEGPQASQDCPSGASDPPEGVAAHQDRGQAAEKGTEAPIWAEDQRVLTPSGPGEVSRVRRDGQIGVFLKDDPTRSVTLFDPAELILDETDE